MADSAKTIGEMTDEEARFAMLRAIHDALGVVPEEAVRHADGGYMLSLHMPAHALTGLHCRDCGRVAEANIHRPDNDCEDKRAHLREEPDLLHHPFVLDARETEHRS